jgi:hypothetical protein
VSVGSKKKDFASSHHHDLVYAGGLTAGLRHRILQIAISLSLSAALYLMEQVHEPE